jgi:hypothetical protein
VSTSHLVAVKGRELSCLRLGLDQGYCGIFIWPESQTTLVSYLVFCEFLCLIFLIFCVLKIADILEWGVRLLSRFNVIFHGKAALH